MSKTANLVVRAVVDGKRKNLSPKLAKQLGVKGTYYLRTWEGGKEKWQSLGSDPSVARVAVIRKEREFAEQVRAVIKAAGLKARLIASPERLAHLASARLRRVAHPPIEDGGSAARKHSMTNSL